MLLNWLMRAFFNLLYHSFAWSYDLVAGLVSGGRWKDWVRSVVPLVQGSDVLELGMGTGTLQAALCQAGFHVSGMDESRQMLRIVKRKLVKLKISPRSIRSTAQTLPLLSDSFDTIVATFPSEYIFQVETLQSCRRVLHDGGKLVILLGVEVGGKGLGRSFLRGLYRFTRQDLPSKAVLQKVNRLFSENGFDASYQTIIFKEDRLSILMAYSSVDMPIHSFSSKI